MALNECARVAQQVNDDVCLQHNVAQLCRLQANTFSADPCEQDSADCCDSLDQCYKLLSRCSAESVLEV